MTTRDPDQYLLECTRIDDFDLQAEFVRVPADLAYWSARYAEAYKRWLESKLAHEQLTAAVSLSIRDMLTAQSKGRVTAAEVEQTLFSTEDYKRSRELEINCEAEKLRLNGVVSAIAAKKEMLISLGAHQRAEMGNDPLIRQRHSVAEEVDRSKRGL